MIHPKYHTPEEIKHLIDRYFDATISTEDMDNLSSIAANIPEELTPYPYIVADLEMIATLSQVSSSILESRIPSSLESRLDSHISRLARKEKWRRRIAISLSSAAAVAIMFSVGLYLNRDSAMIPQQAVALQFNTTSDTIQTTAPNTVANTPSVVATVSSEVSGSSSQSKTTRYASAKKNYIHKKEGNTQQTGTGGATASETQPVVKTLNLNPLPAIPSASEVISDTPSLIAAATVDPITVLAQPISTLSQSIDNVYASIESVAEIFQDINQTLREATALALSPELSEPDFFPTNPI